MLIELLVLSTSFTGVQAYGIYAADFFFKLISYTRHKNVVVVMLCYESSNKV